MRTGRSLRSKDACRAASICSAAVSAAVKDAICTRALLIRSMKRHIVRDDAIYHTSSRPDIVVTCRGWVGELVLINIRMAAPGSCSASSEAHIVLFGQHAPQQARFNAYAPILLKLCLMSLIQRSFEGFSSSSTCIRYERSSWDQLLSASRNHHSDSFQNTHCELTPRGEKAP